MAKSTDVEPSEPDSDKEHKADSEEKVALNNIIVSDDDWEEEDWDFEEDEPGIIKKTIDVEKALAEIRNELEKTEDNQPNKKIAGDCAQFLIREGNQFALKPEVKKTIDMPDMQMLDTLITVINSDKILSRVFNDALDGIKTSENIIKNPAVSIVLRKNQFQNHLNETHPHTKKTQVQTEVSAKENSENNEPNSIKFKR